MIQLIRRALKKRRYYESPKDWLLSVYDGILRRLRMPLLPGRGRVVGVRIRGLEQPVFLRLGTSDWIVLWEVFFERVYEEFIASCPENVETIVDLGANIGLTVRFWQQNFPHAAIVAVEPDPENVAMIKRNVSVTDYSERVHIVEACAAATSGAAYLDRAGGSWEFRMTDKPTTYSIPVNAISVDQIIKQANASESIDLLKCDIEGAEREVFASCGDWIQAVSRIAVEVHGKYQVADLLRDTETCGRRFRIRHIRAGLRGDGLAVLEPVEKHSIHARYLSA